MGNKNWFEIVDVDRGFDFDYICELDFVSRIRKVETMDNYLTVFSWHGRFEVSRLLMDSQYYRIQTVNVYYDVLSAQSENKIRTLAETYYRIFICERSIKKGEQK